MKLQNIIIWFLGMGLITLLGYLTYDWFSDRYVFYLNLAIIVCCYTLPFYVYSGTFGFREEFEGEVPSTGVRIYILWSYIFMALSMIALGKFLHLSFLWQLFFHLSFLFLVVIGLLLANASVTRLGAVSNQSIMKQKNKEELTIVAHKALLIATNNKSMDPSILSDLINFVEKIAYITPSNSSAAQIIESELQESISTLATLISSRAENESISNSLEKAKNILSQRMKIY